MIRAGAGNWAVIAACVVVLAIGQGAALAVPLSDLLGGATITVGNSRFVDWQLSSLDATGTAPNLAMVAVTPLAGDLLNPGLEFTANNQLVTSGINSINLAISYRIERIAGGSFSSHTIAMTGISFGGPGGISYMSDELANLSGLDIAIAVALANKVTNSFELVNTASFVPKSVLRVATDVSLAGFDETDAINLSKYTQRFAQNGPLGLPGDYNEDGTVEATDYTVWRDYVGSPAFTLPNDTVGGTIGMGQYNLWKSKFGTGGSGAFDLPIAVPEPSTGAIVLMAAAILLGTCFKFRARRVACFHGAVGARIIQTHAYAAFAARACHPRVLRRESVW